MKYFKYYLISWVVSLALFNIIVFVSASGNINATFWVGYIFITIAFLGNLACAAIAFKPENATKKFYNISILTESCIGLVAVLAVGTAFMSASFLPTWIGIAICGMELLLSILAIVKACAASEIVSNIDDKVASETSFIKTITVEASSLIPRAKSESVRVECTKVYEAFRYSPKRSGSSSIDLEDEIRGKFDDFKLFVVKNDSDMVTTLADELIALIGERNTTLRT